MADGDIEKKLRVFRDLVAQMSPTAHVAVQAAVAAHIFARLEQAERDRDAAFKLVEDTNKMLAGLVAEI